MSQPTTKKKFSQIVNKNFILLFVAYTIICMAHSMCNQTLGAYQKSIGMEATLIGLIGSTMSLAAFIIRPFSAPLTDRGNKKKVFLAAVCLFVVAIFLYSRATTPGTAVIAKVMHGIAWTFISTVTAVILSEYVPREDYGTALGFFMVSQMIASAIAPTVAFAIANAYSYAIMYMLFAGIAAIGAVMVMFIAPTPVRKLENQTSMFSGIQLNNLFAKEAILPMAVNLVYQGTRSGITVFMAVFALEELGIVNIGLFSTFASFTAWVARPILGSILDKKGALITLVPAGVSFSLGLLCLTMSQNLTMFCIAGVLIGFGQSGISPVLMAISMRCVPEERKAAANATNYLGMDIGSAIASAASGFIVASFGYRAGFGIYIVPVMLVTVVAGIYLSKTEAAERKLKESN